MLAHVSQIRQPNIDWNAKFVEMLPTMLYNLNFEFKKLDDERKEETVQEAIANYYVAFRRLVQQGRSELAYPTVLARYAAAQFRDGRKVGSRMNANDVSSHYAQRRRGILLQSLDRFDDKREEWREAVIEDTHTSVFRLAAFRIDFPNRFKRLTLRNRKIALALARGFTTSWVARKFRLSSARISQLRRELCDSWFAFHAGPNGPETQFSAA